MGITTSIATSVTDSAIAILGVAVVGVFFAVWHAGQFVAAVCNAAERVAARLVPGSIPGRAGRLLLACPCVAGPAPSGHVGALDRGPLVLLVGGAGTCFITSTGHGEPAMIPVRSEVLDGDDPVCAPVLVDDHDQLPASVPQFAERGQHRLAARHRRDRPRQLAHRPVRGCAVCAGDHGVGGVASRTRRRAQLVEVVAGGAYTRVTVPLHVARACSRTGASIGRMTWNTPHCLHT
jgi:hypothetical protein